MKTRAWKVVLFCGLSWLWGSSISLAQNGIVSIYKVGGLISGTTVRAGDNVRFLMRYNNNTGQKCDVSNGFKLSSPDGATWDSTTIDSIGPIVAGESKYFIPYFDVAFALFTGSPDGMGEDTVGMIGAGTGTKPLKQMPNGFNDSVVAVTAWFNGNKNSAGRHICIDTSFYGQSGTWVWVGRDLTNYYPIMQGLTPSQPYSEGLPGTRLGSGYCFDLYAPMLIVSKTELTFTTQEGTGDPPPQTFDVTSSGDGLSDHLNFSLIEAVPWIIKSPATGTTPRTILVSVNTAGLSAGIYTDSIRVESSGASNSPLYVRVVLSVTSPAPTIAVSKSSFSFVGLEGGSDPAAQTLIVKNTGGGSLHWTMNHVQPWLVLAPPSGIDSAQVSVSASLAGLPTGEYLDTIQVSDPAATNNPVKIPIRLSVGSSLPSIVVDSAVNHILSPSGSSMYSSRSVYVRNGGVGALTFSITENSSRIQSVVPTSGVAPESVQVNFKVSGSSGVNLYDTIWVSSPEATNSPYPVQFLTRIVDTPAVISLNRDTVSFTTYQCTQGPTSPLPLEFLVVTNAGGGDPMTVDLTFDSDLFTLSSTSQQSPAQFTVQALYPELPAGVYYDTILVTSVWASNTPQRVIVRYERSAGTQRKILVPLDSAFVTRQEQTGPALVKFKITNEFPGCMPWSVDEEIPWFTPSKTSGNAPDSFSGLVDIDALTLGKYRDSLYLVSPGAINSPRKLVLVVRVWRYYGDCNWSGFVDLVDLSWLVSFLTSGQPMPQPDYVIGNVDCDEMVDLPDLSTLVAFLTGQDVYLCGNP